MPKKKTKVYRGPLGKPITTKQIEAIERRNQNTFGLLNEPPNPVYELHMKKLVGLALDYSIDLKSPDGWFQLAYALALKHEPGFTVKKKPEGGGNGEKLLRAVEEIQAGKGLKTDRATLKALYPDGYLPSLEARLREAKAARKKREAARKKLKELEEAAAASREAFVQEAELLFEGPRPKTATSRKRRS
jgi:hypothetical protein